MQWGNKNISSRTPLSGIPSLPLLSAPSQIAMSAISGIFGEGARDLPSSLKEFLEQLAMASQDSINYMALEGEYWVVRERVPDPRHTDPRSFPVTGEKYDRE